MGIRWFGDVAGESWEEFCADVTSSNFIDQLDGTPIQFDTFKPIRRVNDIAKNYKEIKITEKFYGTAAYGDTNFRWFESNITGEKIDEELQRYNDEHGTNYKLDENRRIAGFLISSPHGQKTFAVNYRDDGNEAYGISGFDNSSYVWLYGLKWVGDYGPSLYVKDDSSVYNPGSISINSLNESGTVVSAGSYEPSGKFNESYVDINIPIFERENQAHDYVENGFTDNNKKYCINYKAFTDETEDIEPKYYYYSMSLMKNGVEIDYLHWDINTFDRVNAYKVDGFPNNINFNATRSLDADIRKSTIRYNDNGTWSTYSNVDTDFLITLTEGKFTYIENEIYKSGDVFTTNVTTNLTLWHNKEDSTLNIYNQLDDSLSINSGKSLSTYKIRTGTEIEETANNNINAVGFTKTFELTKTQLRKLGGVLWSTDNSIYDAILDGAHLTNNPVDMIVSSFYFPINISQFVQFGERNYIDLGGYTVEETGVLNVIDGTKVSTIGSTFINSVFNNHLDYTNVNTTLYLPFVGLVPISYSTIINTVLSIDCVVDCMNASMKYYIKSNNKLISEYGCNFGMSIPVTGADVAGKQRELVSDAFNVVSEFGQGGTSFAKGDLFGTIGSAGSLINTMQEISSAPATLYRGSSSSGTSCSDVLYPYIIFDVQEAIIPSTLYSEYGYPSNRIGTIGSSKGWTEVHDVKVVGDMMEAERNEIESLLSQGVIV